MTYAQVTPESVNTDPSERSIPSLRITTVAARARIRSTAF